MNKKYISYFLAVVIAILILFFVFRSTDEDKIVRGKIVKVDLGARQVVIKMDNKELTLGVLPELTKVFDAEGNELTLGALREGLNIKTDASYVSDIDVDLFVVGRITIER
jgi:hypothetical protein